MRLKNPERENSKLLHGKKCSLMKRTRNSLAQSTPRKIRTIAETIGRTFHPEKVVLFGSHAYGRPHRDSDVDLFIIMETKLRPVEQAVAIRQALDCPFPLDLLVRTPEQIKERLRLGDYFMSDILRRGVVLYEADHA